MKSSHDIRPVEALRPTRMVTADKNGPIRALYYIVALSSAPRVPDLIRDFTRDKPRRDAAGITGATIYIRGHLLEMIEGSFEDIELEQRRLRRCLQVTTIRTIADDRRESRVFNDWAFSVMDADRHFPNQSLGYRPLRGVQGIVNTVPAGSRPALLMKWFIQHPISFLNIS